MAATNRRQLLAKIRVASDSCNLMATTRRHVDKNCGIHPVRTSGGGRRSPMSTRSVVSRPVAQLTPAQAAHLLRSCRRGFAGIAVEQHPLQMKVDANCRILKPAYFQTDVEDLRELTIPAHIRCFRQCAAAKNADSLPKRMWSHPRADRPEMADWGGQRTRAAKPRCSAVRPVRAEWAEAIQAVRPFGVDVSRGVEDRSGSQDPAKFTS